MASLIVDEDSQRDDFGYAFESLTDSVVLRKNRNYVITSEEQSGSGDLWCDQGPRKRASMNAPIKILHDCSGVSGSVFPNQGSKNTSKAAMGVPTLYTFPIISSCSNFPSFETCTSSSRFSILDSGRTIEYVPRKKKSKEEEEEEEKKSEEKQEEESKDNDNDGEEKSNDEEDEKWDVAMFSNALKGDGAIHRWCVTVENCPVVAVGVLSVSDRTSPPSQESSPKTRKDRRDELWAEKNLSKNWLEGSFVVLSRETIVSVVGDGEEEDKQFTPSRLTSLTSIAKASKSKVIVDTADEDKSINTYALELDTESGVLKISANGGHSKEFHISSKLSDDGARLYPAVAFQSYVEYDDTKTKDKDEKEAEEEKDEKKKYRASIRGAGLSSDSTVEMHPLHSMTRTVASLAGTCLLCFHVCLQSSVDFRVIFLRYE